MDKKCCNCGSEDDVSYYAPRDEFFCDVCIDEMEDEINGERIANE